MELYFSIMILGGAKRMAHICTFLFKTLTSPIIIRK